MSARTTRRRWARLLTPLAAAAFAVAGLGVASATTTTVGHGENDFGLTTGFYRGHQVEFTYSKGFFCDTTVAAASTTGCEAGQKWKVAPSTQHDPLYITVPLGFSVPHRHIDCPDRLTCVDHPSTMDLSRLAPALAPLFNTTPDKLAPALRDFATPGHDHFLGDLNAHKGEWWDVYVVGITDKATYDRIHAHRDLAYITSLLKAKDPHVVGPIPTNLFLFFAAK
ncbi:MAG: hypothetical protein M0Z98_12570 [Actinomycetales bacterium]|nr:hypothetical protein [Actinomycetales bacterium]